MSIASPTSLRSSSRTSIEISPKLKPRDLNALLKDVQHKGPTAELFLYASEGRVFMTTQHEELRDKQTENTNKMLNLLKQRLVSTSQSTNINDVFLDIRKVAKNLPRGKSDCGVRKENDHIAVGARQLSGLLTHKHDPLSQEGRTERKQIIENALGKSLKALHAMCSVDAKLDGDDDRSPVLAKSQLIGSRVAEALVDEFIRRNKNCGKHELALFRMSFLVDDHLKNPLKQVLHDECAHVMRDDIYAAFSQGLQETIGNVTTDGTLITDENVPGTQLKSLCLDGGKLHFAENAGKGGHGIVNIYRSNSDSLLSFAVKSPVIDDDDPLQTLATCQRELALHLQAQGIGHENVVEVVGALRFGNGLHIMMEDCSLGTLDSFVSKKLANALENQDIASKQYRQAALTLARDVLAGLNHLHRSSGVLHLDMKPGNVFIGIDGRAKIGDFDRSLKGSAVTGNIRNVPDTAQYLSPRLQEAVTRYRAELGKINNEEAKEVKTAKDTNTKKQIYAAARQARKALNTAVSIKQDDDVFAAGLTLFELLYGVNPFMVNSTGTQTVERMASYAQANMQERRQMLFDDNTLPPALRPDEKQIQDLLMQMLDPREDMRCNLNDALAHPLFADEALGSDEARTLIRQLGGLA